MTDLHRAIFATLDRVGRAERGEIEADKEEVYEVILVYENGTEEWVPCLEAKELCDGRLAAEVLLGNIIFRKPGRWRKVPMALYARRSGGS